MNDSPRRRTVTFIVRVWAEYLDEVPARWHGVIEPVGFGKKFYFSQLDEITDFITHKTQHKNPTEDEA